ncbi:putative sterigmatocystin biosynthesis monooxygenase [Lachnellula willkommii]|uniref:Putative sterigmatocystin biosynthesis monooxygenase n=1 Tax=Lachnellula willkommii TaxID=215461 RepID=A0A559MFG3_9HELO|nr:putative sterigmatocystin biosynthesis monooxygenase [Lachnellula willkommii]
MSSATIVSTVPTVDSEPALGEKAPINSSSTSPVEQRSASKFELEDHPIDIKPKIRVAVIGAGLAGITAGVLLPVKVPGIDLTIFDKNADVGGTWFENIYPGVRCDIPANVYQSTFAPNTQWSEEYAQGAEIRDYWQGVARKYNVYQYLKLKRRVIGATWSETEGFWTVEVENLETGDKSKEIFDVVITAIGRFNAWRLPDYSGIKDYKGHLRHASAWDPTFDPAGKTVAVIGNGASGIQLVPNLQKVVKHLDHYARSKTWIAGSFGGEGAGRRLEPNYYAAELLKTFEDPEVYRKFRKELESKFYRRFGTIFKDSKENNGLREEFITLMSTRLSKKPELLEHIVPDFSPNCRRLTPGPGYLEALTEDNVSFIRDPISHFTAEGIVTADGTERKVDAVICATGANIDMIPPSQSPPTAETSAMHGGQIPSATSGSLPPGPNAAGHSGTVPNQVETQVTYLAKLLRKVSTQNIKSFAPSQAATDDFVAYSDKFFERTVFSGNCSSWANGGIPGARIHGHWPGSASHLNIVRRNPRWEDWEWTTKARSGNRFAWFGNGWTAKEESGEGDLTPYLKVPASIDLRSYHEEWFEGL